MKASKREVGAGSGQAFSMHAKDREFDLLKGGRRMSMGSRMERPAIMKPNTQPAEYAIAQQTCLLWFGHGCSLYRMQSNMNVIMVWMLGSPYAVKRESYYGLGMDALISARTRT